MAEEAAVEEKQEPSELEVKAMEMGWNPEGVEGKRNLSAEEFVDRKEIYDEIHSLKKSLKNQKKTYETLVDHHKKVKESEYKRAIADLKAQKVEALEADNHSKVVEIDDQIIDLKEEQKEARQPTQDSNDAFDSWVSRNGWYDNDAELKQAADDLGRAVYSRDPNQPLSEIYDYVSGQIKRMYPEKFTNPRRGKPSKVEGAGGENKDTGSKKYTVKDLSQDQRDVMRRLVRAGGITEEEYIQELIAIGEIA